MEKKTVNIAIDCGNGYSKASVNGITIKFPSVVAVNFGRTTIPLKEGVVIPEGIPILTVCDAPCDPETEGNILILAKTSESEETDLCQFSYDVISSDPEREVALLNYSSADMKSVQFPIKIAEAVDHFRREGVLLPSFHDPKEENISLWFAASAGIVILCALLISKK